MTSQRSDLPAEYIAMLERDGHRNPPAFAHTLANMFTGLDFSGKKVLEIGSGRGLLAIYMGMRGAQVLSMEPEMVGATSGVIAQQQARLASLGMRNVEVVNADFNTWDAAGRRFDVIVSRASINHLYASEHHAEHHKETYDAYLEVARRVHSLLAPGGTFVATDACRYAFFSGMRQFGIRRPWRWERSSVDWRHHQNPSTWKKIFRDAGFSSIEVDYPVPYKLRTLRPVINTATANFFLQGAFILRARR
jgi:cyclopropane fatty-acyl-phospholipid synthase-like methyltransferase